MFPFFRLVPEEELTLCQFFPLSLGAEYRFQRVGMVSGVPCFRGYCHRSGGKVLHLFQMKIQPFGNNGKFRHIFFFASGMRGNKIRNQLLAQVFLFIDSVEYPFECFKLLERRFAHCG